MHLVAVRTGGMGAAGPNWDLDRPRQALAPRGGASRRRTAPAPGRLALALIGHGMLLTGLVLLSQMRPKDIGQPETAMQMVFTPAPAPAPRVMTPPAPKPAPLRPAVPAPPQPAKPPPPAPVAPQSEAAPVPLPPPPAPPSQAVELPLPPVPPSHIPAERPILSRAPSAPAASRAVPRETAALPSRPAAPAASVLVPPRPVAGMETDRPPIYPEMARRLGEQGRVILRVSVSPSGSPLGIVIGTSSGFHVLDNAAADAVRDWRFVPATDDGHPVAAIAIIPIQFRLAD